MMYKFYDTCSLLLKANHLWDEDCTLVISSITLEELEHIKTSANKDPDVKFAARKVVHELDQHYGDYEIVIWSSDFALSLLSNEDGKIIACADWFARNHQDDEVIFVTNDLCCKHLARTVLSIPVESYQEEAYDSLLDIKSIIILKSNFLKPFYFFFPLSNPSIISFTIILSSNGCLTPFIS